MSQTTRFVHLRNIPWLAIITSLLLGNLNASAAAANTPSTHSQTRVVLDAVTMVTPTIGWAINQYHVLRTVDGGRVWTSVTPKHFQSTDISGPQPSEITPNTTWTFVGKQDAWIAQGGLQVGAPSRSVSIYHTVNGGQQWSRFTLSQSLPRTFTAVGGTVSPLQLDMLGQQGWLVLTAGRAALQMPTLLEHTTSGGRSWQPVWNGMGNEGPVAFASARIGWMVPGIAMPLLRRTTDGGHTWHTANPPLPPRITSPTLQGEIAPSLALPRFFKGAHGVWPIVSGYGPTHWAVRLYTAIDQGQRWKLGPPSLHLQQDGAIDAQIVTARIVWILQSSSVAHTSNDGSTWVTDPLPPSLGTPIALTAASNRTAWVLSRSRSGISELWETNDGGRQWTIVTPHKST